MIEPFLGLVLEAYAEKSVKLRYDEDSASFPDNPVADEEFIDLDVSTTRKRYIDKPMNEWIDGWR